MSEEQPVGRFVSTEHQEGWLRGYDVGWEKAIEAAARRCPGMAEQIRKLKMPEGTMPTDENETSQVFVHVTPKVEMCKDGGDHDFQEWRNLPDGNGGEQVCAKCGLGAMAYTLGIGL